MQNLFFTGNVGLVREPATVKGNQVLNFTVAVNEYYKKGDETIEETTWYECTLWRRENIYPYIKKGTEVAISGKIGARAYLDKEGKPTAVLTCLVEKIEYSNRNGKQEE